MNNNSKNKPEGIDFKKLETLYEFTNKNSPKNSKEIMPFLMNAKKAAQSQNINFSDEETDLIVQYLKQSLNESERRKVDLFRNLMKRNG